jgi:hypothetical protein
MRLTTGQIGRFDFSKTAKPIGDELATRSQRLSIKDGDLRGSVLGVFSLTTRLKVDGARRWFLPAPTLLGKLGERHGPSIDEVIVLAQLRQAFKEGAPLPELPETPVLTAPPRAPGPKPVITSGRQALASPEPPQIESYDGPDDPSDPIPF